MPAKTSPLVPFIGTRSPRILIVDDDPTNLKVLAAHLSRWGCLVREVDGGAEALGHAKAFSPDLVLLDVMMPDRSGFDVCRDLQADEDTKHVPVIFLSALSGREAKMEGFATGGLDYVTKPFIAADLAARVGVRLREKYVEDDLRARHAQLIAQLSDAAPENGASG
jgi:DNA-binding response OmpR family regulator